MNSNQDGLSGHQDTADGGGNQFSGQPESQPSLNYGSLPTEGGSNLMVQGQVPMEFVHTNRMPILPMQQQHVPNSGMLPIPSGCPSNALPGNNVDNMRFPAQASGQMYAQYPHLGGNNSQVVPTESSEASILTSDPSDSSQNSQSNTSDFQMYPSMIPYEGGEQNVAYFVPCPPESSQPSGADQLNEDQASTLAFPSQFQHGQQQIISQQQLMQQQSYEVPPAEMRFPVPSEANLQMNPNVFPGEQFQYQDSFQQMQGVEKQSFQEETQHKHNDQEIANNAASHFCQEAVPNQHFTQTQLNSLNCQTVTTMMQNTNVQMQPNPQVQTTQPDENRGFHNPQQLQNFVMTSQPSRLPTPTMQPVMMPQQIGPMPVLASQMVPMPISSQSVGQMPPKLQRMPIPTQHHAPGGLIHHQASGRMPIPRNHHQLPGSIQQLASRMPANIPQGLQRLTNPSQNPVPFNPQQAAGVSRLPMVPRIPGPKINPSMGAPAGQMINPTNTQHITMSSQQRVPMIPVGMRPRFMQPRMINSFQERNPIQQGTPMQHVFAPRPITEAMRNTVPLLQQQPSLSKDQPQPSTMVPLSMPMQPNSSQLLMTHGGPNPAGNILVPGPPQFDKVHCPWGWKRVLLGDKIVYFTPSGIQLNSNEEVKDYLMTEGTCKCGLDCPLVIERAFDFDQNKPTEMTQPNSIPVKNNGCKHVKDTLAIAQIQNSTGFAVRHHHNPILKSKEPLKKKVVKTKKKPFSGVKVSQMLAAREAEKQKQRIVEIIAQQKAEHEASLQQQQQENTQKNGKGGKTPSKKMKGTPSKAAQVEVPEFPSSEVLESVKTSSEAAPTDSDKTSSSSEEVPTLAQRMVHPALLQGTKIMNLGSAAQRFGSENIVISPKNLSRRSSLENTPSGSQEGPRPFSLAEAMQAARKLNLDQEVVVEKTEETDDIDSNDCFSDIQTPEPVNDIDDLVEEQAEGSDLAKNIEIRRLSSTDEGNKVLEPSFHSPEKEAKKNPLGNLLNIVSGMELPPPTKFMEEQRFSGPSGFNLIRPQMKGKKRGQLSVPFMPPHANPWPMGLPPMQRGPRPMLPANMQLQQSQAVQGQQGMMMQAQPMLMMGGQQVQMVQTPLNGMPMIQTPSSGMPMIQTPASGVQMVQTPASGVQMVQTPSNGMPMVPNPASGVPMVQTPVSGIQMAGAPAGGLQQQPMFQMMQTMNGTMLVQMPQQMPLDSSKLIPIQPSPQVPSSPSSGSSSKSSSPSSSTQGSPTKKKGKKRKNSTAVPVQQQQLLVAPGGNVGAGPMIAFNQVQPQMVTQNMVINPATGQQMVLSNGPIMTMQPLQGVMYQQLPDGSLVQIQNPIIPQAQPIMAGPTVQGQVLVNGQGQFVMTPQGLMQAVGTLPTASSSSSSDSSPKRKKANKKAKGSAMSSKSSSSDTSMETDNTDANTERDSVDDTDTSFEEPQPSTSRDFSPRSSIQSNLVDSSGLNATPPHQKDQAEFEQLRQSKETPSLEDLDNSLDTSRRNSGVSTPSSHISMNEEPINYDSDLDHQIESPRIPKPVSSSKKKKKKKKRRHQSSKHFSLGNIVWGPINGFQSWPGKVVSEDEDRTKVWVCWFQSRQVTQIEISKLKTLSQGLEDHHRDRKNSRRNKKMNLSLEKAIQEAMSELD